MFSGRIRFLLYCHDTFGLGHLRRTLLLAEHFVATLPDAEVLIVTGSPVAHAFTLPPRVDYIKLPAVLKEQDGTYRARDLSMGFLEIRDLRAMILRDTAQAYRPDVFLVDHAPQGWKGEVLPTLSMLHATQPDCLRVLGLRDIVDASSIVRKNWTLEGIYQTLEQSYDLILVYGSLQFYDLGREYALSEAVSQRVRYCGYLNRVQKNYGAAHQKNVPPDPPTTSKAVPTTARQVVLTTGGGGDGFSLMHTYLSGLQHLPVLPFSSVLLTGPLMPDHELNTLRKLAETLPEEMVHIEPFLADPLPLLRNADLVVAMAGYNTSCELLELRQRLLIVPRTAPRQEQLIRASLFAEYGLAQMLHPDLLLPEILIESVQQALERPCPQQSQLTAAGISFQGQAMALQAIVEALDNVRNCNQASSQAIAHVG